MYRELNPERIVETAVLLQQRIQERFPGSGLGRIGAELVEVARAAEQVSSWLSKPLVWVRVSVGAMVVLLSVLVVTALSVISMDMRGIGFSETAQGIEAAINDLVFVGIAIYFLLSVERRIKRRRAMQQFHVLRSLAHVVDMHQLTKDPDAVAGDQGAERTASSPRRDMTPFQLTRYLDYSSELLAIISKIAAIYVQRFDDSETLRAAGDIEDLTVGLSRNIWQKIMILDRIADQD